MRVATEKYTKDTRTESSEDSIVIVHACVLGNRCLQRPPYTCEFSCDKHHRRKRCLILVLKRVKKIRVHTLGYLLLASYFSLPKKMGECHDINYVEYVYYVIMYLIINN